MTRELLLASFFACALTVGCASLQNDLRHAQESYEAERYQRAALWLERLEPDVVDMDRDMQAQFYYLRGMTAYRLGAHADAVYYLSLSREVAGDRSSALGPEWRESMNETLANLEPEN